MSRILVVYFSRGGTTRRIARKIAHGCNADIEEIHDAKEREGPFGYARSAAEALLGAQPRIRPPRLSPKDYDLVVIGTPIWCWNISSPVRSYLSAQREGLPQVAFFCTFGGAGNDKVMQELQRICGRSPVARPALTERECAGPEHRARLAKFVRHLLRELKHEAAEEPGAHAVVHA